MTDQNISDVTDEDRRLARKWAESMSPDINGSGTALSIARVILDTVPAPSMAEMTPEERSSCRWMQCDAGPYGRRGLIVKVKYWSVYVVDKETGTYSDYTPDLVTARPDLPRFEWADTEKADDENTVKIGDEIESADDPRIAALPVGSILLDCDGERVTRFDINPAGWRGPGYVPIAGEGTEYGSWVVVRIGQEADQ